MSALTADEERSPGVGVARLGDAPLPPFPRRVFRRREAEVAHELARGVGAREVAQFGHQDDGARELDPTQRLDEEEGGLW